MTRIMFLRKWLDTLADLNPSVGIEPIPIPDYYDWAANPDMPFLLQHFDGISMSLTFVY